MTQDPHKSDSNNPSFRESVEQIAEGCYGCIGIIAVLLFCLGFFGLRAAFRAATTASDSNVEIRQQHYRAIAQEHVIKSQEEPPHQDTSYLVRIICGSFGLAATVAGAILLLIFVYYLKSQQDRELDKKWNSRQIGKSRDRNSDS